MKRLTPSTALLFSVFLSTLGFNGCSGFSGTNSPDVPAQVSLGTISGSVFGGHAPIAFAHLYVLEVDPSGSGYGAKVKSLLSSGSTATSGTYPVAQDGYADATNGFYYVTTSTLGEFNVSGDYTCDAGYPVFLYAAGGSPGTLPSVGITAASETNGGGPIYTYTVTFTGSNLLYVGQSVQLSGLTGSYAFLNGTIQQVTAATLTSFAVSFTSLNVIGPTDTTAGTAQALGVNNPGIVNLAVLGNCPSTGAQNFSSIKYVYVNEVSTVAAAYALAGFADTTVGDDAVHIGIPAGDALALKGIQNAAANAAQLYNIQGAYTSTTYDGEGHIANPTTPGGTGVVPQATIDTLGNILAACVDSNNTNSVGLALNLGTTGAATSASTQCSLLFGTATADGRTSGTQPVEIATAAINIAHHPAGTANSGFVSTLVGIPAGNVPFSPNLGATVPGDLMVGIQYTAALNPGSPYSYLTGPESVAVDASGDYWFTTQPTSATTSGYFAEASPLGAILHHAYSSSLTYGNIGIDSSGNAWSGTLTGVIVPATEYGPSTSYVASANTDGFTHAAAAIPDNSASSGDVWFAHGPTNTVFSGPGINTNNQELAEVGNGGGLLNGETSLTPSFGTGAYITHGAIDSAGYLWFTSDAGSAISRVNKTNAVAYTGFPMDGSVSTTNCSIPAVTNPEQPSIDASGNAWIPIYGTSGAGNTIVKIAPSSSGNTCTTYSTGNGPFGTAIDGSNNVWIVNSADNTLTELSAASGTALSPSGNYTVGGLLSGPMNVAVDISGDLFVTNFTGNTIVEAIGGATPTYGPLGVAAGNSKLGAKP